MKKKILAWLLCLGVVLTIMPMPAALAAEGDVCEIDGTPYMTLDAALAAVDNGTAATIKLLQTVSRTSTLTIDNAKTITLDLNGCHLNINAASGAAINISGGSSLATTGTGALNASGLEGGIFAQQGSTVSITGDVSATNGGEGVYAYGNGVSVTVTGDVSGNIIGVESLNSASVTVTGTITGGSYGVWAESGSNVQITGDVIANNNTGVHATSATVTVTGNVQATGQSSEGIYVTNGAHVAVSGNVQGGYDGIQASSSCDVSVGGSVAASSATSSFAVYAGSGTQIEIGGDVISAGDCGVVAATGGKVTVTGNIQSVYTGIRVSNSGEVFALGGVIVDNAVGTGINAFETGEATVDGTISAYKTMSFGESDGSLLSQTTKDGYLTYSDGGDYPSYIWLKDTTWSPTPPAVITGEVLDLTATGALILGEVTGDGGQSVTARGVVYATAPDPTLSTGTAVSADMVDKDTFRTALTDLSPNTTYYVRAYATNAGGTAYGAGRSFSTPVSVTTVAVGGMPKQPAVNRVTNKIYVPNNSGNSVTVIDGATDAVISTISLGEGTGPYFAAVNEATNRIYIANNKSNSVSVIDGATDTVTATVPAGTAPRAIAVNETTNTIYVANYMASTVTVINGEDNTVSATLDIGAGTRPTSLAVNETTNKLYTANYWNNTISVIDCVTGTVDAVIPASAAQDSPRFVNVNEQTNKIYVANYRSQNVTVIDGSDNSYEYVTVGVDPWEIAVNENTNQIYVSTDGETAVAIIDGETNEVNTAPAGEAPQAIGINTVTNMAYVGNCNSDERSEAGFIVTQINGVTLEAVGFADTSSPSFITVNELTNKVYVINFDNTVTIIALAQAPALSVAGTATDNTAILQIDNKTPSARDKTWEISVTAGTVKEGVSASDVTLTGLPAGLDYTAAKGAGNTIVITLTGEAATALTADATVTAVIKGSAVTEADAQDSAGISLKLWYVGAGTTLVLTNEAGGLIDQLIAAGHGYDTLYEVLELLQPDFSSVITERFMKTLLSTPADNEVFDENAFLGNFAGLNNPVCINMNGNMSISGIFGRDYHCDTGYTTTGSNLNGVGTVWATIADSSAYYIDAGSSGVIDGTTTYYKAFAILWMPELPAVTTDAVESSGVTLSSADVSGSVTSAGTASVTERGFVYGATANPTTSDTKVTAALGTGTGAFSATLTGLSANTTYHVRAYAISAAGTAYGADRTFTTLTGSGGTDDDPPAVVTNTVTDITASGATLNGNVTSDGGATVTARGFVYGATANPAIGGAGVTQAASGSGTGAFTANISGLTAGSTYHVRAYATNSEGTSYGTDVTFTTLTGGGPGPGPEDNPPAVVTNTVTDITASGATLNGNVTSDGGATVTARGFVYGATANPAIGGAGVTQAASGSGTGAFTANISGLTAGSTYHVRAYATNSEGTSYGTDVTFTTLTGGGGEPDDPYIFRTLTDSATGITVSGVIHRDAALTVKNTVLHAAGTCAACDAIRARMTDSDFITLIDKDISLSLGFTGSLTVTIPVGSAYNGETVTILHCASGTLKTYTATVKDGKATFTVTSLSPFAVFADADELDNIPKTGDGGGFPLWLGLMASGVLLGSVLVLRRRPKRA